MTGPKKVGRPKEVNPRNRRVTVRMTEEEFAKLEAVSDKKNLTKTEAILKGIELLESEK
ncbi:TPA: hypothetical protein ACGOYB_002153 [Streptococcus suis]